MPYIGLASSTRKSARRPAASRPVSTPSTSAEALVAMRMASAGETPASTYQLELAMLHEARHVVLHAGVGAEDDPGAGVGQLLQAALHRRVRLAGPRRRVGGAVLERRANPCQHLVGDRLQQQRLFDPGRGFGVPAALGDAEVRHDEYVVLDDGGHERVVHLGVARQVGEPVRARVDEGAGVLHDSRRGR